MAASETIVTVRETGAGAFQQEVKAGAHVFIADEPQSLGGQDAGPAPYDLLLSALGTCTAMTIRMYANQKKWPLDRVEITLRHRKETGEDGVKRDIITRDIALTGALDETQRQRLLEIADKCPIHRTLENKPTITSQLVAADAKTPVAPPPDAPKPPGL